MSQCSSSWVVILKSEKDRGSLADVICLDPTIDTGELYESAKIVINTSHFSCIDGWVCSQLEGKFYDVHIREIGWESIPLWKYNLMNVPGYSTLTN